MCEHLQISKICGYQYAAIKYDTNYVWNKRCENNDSVSLKLVIPARVPDPTVLIGLPLYLSEYLAQALNKSIRFLESVQPKTPSPDSEFDYSVDGDVLASNYLYFFSNPRTKRIRSISSPIYTKNYGSILSLKKPISLNPKNLVRIFDSYVYLYLFVTVVSIATFFWLFRAKTNNFRKSQGFFRDLFEVAMLLAFDFPIPHLNSRKNHVTRLVLGSLILIGLVIESIICGQLSAICAVTRFRHVTDFGHSLTSDPEVTAVIGADWTGNQATKSMPELKNYRTPLIPHNQELEILKRILSGDSVFFETGFYVSIVMSRYPELPVIDAELPDKMWHTSAYFFPVLKSSLFFDEIHLR